MLSRFGEDERKEGKEKLSGKQLLVATFRHMKKKNQILIIPLTFWSGIEQGFFGADFTAVSQAIKLLWIIIFHFRVLSPVLMVSILLEEFSLSLEFVMLWPLLVLDLSSNWLEGFPFLFSELVSTWPSSLSCLLGLLQLLLLQVGNNTWLFYWSSGVRALPVAAGTNEGGHYFA